jgi:oxaloacetate decarboxylase alpha subunit
MQGAENRLDEVLDEVPRVRKDLGYPPLVTPTSQIVGTQAVLNVLTGERYKMVPKEVKQYVKGMYGKSPVEISDEVVKKIIADEDRISCRPADLLTSDFEEKKKEIAMYYEDDEDVLSYILFPQVAENYFKYRQAKKYKLDSTLLNIKDKVYPV